MNDLYLTESLLYYATITCDKENYTKLYKGICETTFKRRYANHNKSFNIPAYKNDTKLSTEYWVLKAKQLNSKEIQFLQSHFQKIKLVPKREMRNSR